MTRDDVIRMAREAAAPEWWDEPSNGWHMGLDLERFASLVREYERKDLADWIEGRWADHQSSGQKFAEAIRLKR